METAAEKYGSAFAQACAEALIYGMGAEYIDLTDGAPEVLRDFADLTHNEYSGNAEAAVKDYSQNIGAGNLNSYARTMLVRARKGW